MKRGLIFILAATLGFAQGIAAHDGEDHAPAAAPLDRAVSAARPRLLPDGELFVSKPAQRLLGIRTEPYAPGQGSVSEELQGEVIAAPNSGGLVSAPQTGILRAPEQGWLQPGSIIKAGQVLAYIDPQMNQRDAARRRAQLAEYQQRVSIAQINADRLRLQVSGTDDGFSSNTSGNIYYEQAVAELDAASKQRDLIAASLSDRLPLRAKVDGILQRNLRRAGETVSTGDDVFEITDPLHLGVAAYTFDPRLGARLQSAALGGHDDAALQYRGQELLGNQPGWRLLFDLYGANAGLLPGMPVRLRITRAADAGAGQIARACVIGAHAQPLVWVHVAPERFAARSLGSCDSTAGHSEAFKNGDRLVVTGGVLLAQYL